MRPRVTSLVLALSLLLLVGCGDDTTTPPNPRTWQLLGERRPSALLAVWAGGPDNVWVVGGREGSGGAPTVLHYDGAAWQKLDSGQLNVDLWQVFGIGDTVFMGGSNGTILRYRNGVFDKLPTPGTDIVFGLWASAPDDVWAVGGQTAGAGFAWRYRGTQFEPVAGLPAEISTSTVWKVTGRSANDVWMSCSKGLVLHWDGVAISEERIGGMEESLFSIGCGTERCVTAGTNISNGVLYQQEGGVWTSRVPTEDGPVWRGVTPVGDQPVVVGAFGSVISLENGSWVIDAHGLTTESLHATWIDGDDLFAVGGKFDRAITIDGVLLYKGPVTLPALP